LVGAAWRATARTRGGTLADRRERLVGRKGTDPMDVKIKATVNFSVSDSGMEDALAEFDELTVEGLIREILDKAIACDEISVKVIEGPNNLEEFDQLNT
jgi:hypothetical protein